MYFASIRIDYELKTDSRKTGMLFLEEPDIIFL